MIVNFFFSESISRQSETGFLKAESHEMEKGLFIYLGF